MRNTPHRLHWWKKINSGLDEDGNPQYVHQMRSTPAMVSTPERAVEGVELVAWIPQSSWDLGVGDSVRVDSAPGQPLNTQRKIASVIQTRSGIRLELGEV